MIDSEAIAVDDNGLSVFDLIRNRRQDHAVTLCAFDLLELDGEDLRWEPIVKDRSGQASAYVYFEDEAVRIHQTLKVTPAMAAGVTDTSGEISDMVKVLE